MNTRARAATRSLRSKLLLLVALPFVVVMPAIFVAAASWSRDFVYTQLYQRATTDLAVARDAFARIQHGHLSTLEKTAESYAFRNSLQHADHEQLRALLDLLAVTADFDFVRLADPRGQDRFEPRVVASKPSALWQGAIRNRLPAYGVEVYTPAELAPYGDALVRRASLSIVPTRHAAPTTRKFENRALVLRAVYPLRSGTGDLVGLLDAGVLLNRNHAFVDRLRQLVYGPGSLPPEGWGAATVLLGDVRISTNAPLSQGERALGTRAARDVRAAVLERGADWVDRSFEINDWYISAYAPIVDADGSRVGMLHAGFAEAPYRNAYYRAMGALGAALLGAGLLLAFVMALGAGALVRPVESMMRVVRAVKAGERQRIGNLASRDEIGELAREFDTMLDLLEDKNRQISAAADVMEEKVEARTAELRAKNRELQRTVDLLHETRQQLVIAEKLAALGELTAGVAHEINNPMAVMLGNLDVVVNELGRHAQPVRTEIDLIVEQIYRVRAIVDKLLQYSRPAHHRGGTAAVDTRALIEDTLVLVRHELARQRAQVDTRFEATAGVEINPRELQQVLVNLIVNAAHAIDDGGRIDIATRDWDDTGVTISVVDSGCGLSAEQCGRVFDPFYTTKSSGTGLGLAVSYGIIRHYGGRITVASTPGEWTRFEVYVRRIPVYEYATDSLPSATEPA